jgi:hypothetical protein
MCFIARDHNNNWISRSWQIISYYVLNLADCIAIFCNLERKKEGTGRCKGDFFWENWVQVHHL